MAGGGCMQLLSGDSYYTNLTNKRNRVNSNAARKIRVMCYDPDATDSSSSDEEDSTSALRKRIVQEINLPLSSIPSAAVSDSDLSSFQGSNSPISPTRGKWVWLGAYDELKKMEFDGLAESNKGSCSVDSGSLLSLSSSPASTTSEMFSGFECIDLQMDLDSLFVNDYGQVFDDLTLFNHLPICEFDGLHPSINLPGFDFELGNDELAWIDTTPL